MTDRDYWQFEVRSEPFEDRQHLEPEFIPQPFYKPWCEFPYPAKYRSIVEKLIYKQGWNPIANKYWVRAYYKTKHPWTDTPWDLCPEDWKPVN
jgi:hypothetical protein